MALRNIAYLHELGHGPYDYKAGLELEVKARNCTIALPLNPDSKRSKYFKQSSSGVSSNQNSSKSNYSTGTRISSKNVSGYTTRGGSSGISGTGLDSDVFSGLCLDLQSFLYRSASRGFLDVGPGSLTNTLTLDCNKIFIDTFMNTSATKEGDVVSLIEPFVVQLDMSLFVIPSQDPVTQVQTSLSSRAAPAPAPVLAAAGGGGNAEANKHNMLKKKGVPPSPHPFHEVHDVGTNQEVLSNWIDFSACYAKSKAYMRAQQSANHSDERRQKRPHNLRTVKITLQKRKSNTATNQQNKTPNTKSSANKSRRGGVNPTDYAYSGGTGASYEQAKAEDLVLRLRASFKDFKYVVCMYVCVCVCVSSVMQFVCVFVCVSLSLFAPLTRLY